MTPEARLKRIQAADDARRAAAKAAEDVWNRDTSHPLRIAYRKAAAKFCDELLAAQADGVSLRHAGRHLGVTVEALRQRIAASQRWREGKSPWPRRKPEPTEEPGEVSAA